MVPPFLLSRPSGTTRLIILNGQRGGSHEPGLEAVESRQDLYQHYAPYNKARLRQNQERRIRDGRSIFAVLRRLILQWENSQILPKPQGG